MSRASRSEVTGDVVMRSTVYAGRLVGRRAEAENAGMSRRPDELALDAALEQARASRREGGIPIGSALATADGTIVSLGHNQRVQRGDSTAHAEVVCLRRAGRRDDWPTLTLASTLSPCIMCTGAILLHRIPRVVIGESATFRGAEELLESAGVEIVRADDQRCVELLRAFVAAHPELWNEDIGVPAGHGASRR